MSKNKKFTLSEAEGLIPQLRFPEFQNEGEWEEVSIESVGNVITGGTPSKEESEYWNGNFVWVTAQDFKGKYIYNSVLKLTDKGKERLRVIPKNSVLVTCIASIGLNAINKVECATNQQINSIVCNKINHYEFVYYVISKNITRLKNLAGQTAVPIISKSVFEKFTIQKPTLPKEQQKIASCLSSLDNLIEAHGQKLDLLKDHKKGLMQNLFPQEGEKVPKLRFKEFKGEWAEKKLAEMYSFKITNSFSRDNLNYENGKVKNIHYGDIHKQFRAMFDITRENVPFINSDLPVKKIAQENYCKEGDIIFADASEDLADIGKAIEIVNLNNEKLVSGLHTLLARPNLEDLSIGFGAYLFQSLKVRKQIQKESQGTKVMSISATRLSNISILFSSKPEQQKIASCLSALDELITAQAEKIEQLKQHKKGLMQGLFPKMNN